MKSVRPLYHLFQLSSYDQWQMLDKEAYKQKKKEVSDILLKRLNHQYPGVIEHVKYIELSTPYTNERLHKKYQWSNLWGGSNGSTIIAQPSTTKYTDKRSLFGRSVDTTRWWLQWDDMEWL